MILRVFTRDISTIIYHYQQLFLHPDLSFPLQGSFLPKILYSSISSYRGANRVWVELNAFWQAWEVFYGYLIISKKLTFRSRLVEWQKKNFGPTHTTNRVWSTIILYQFLTSLLPITKKEKQEKKALRRLSPRRTHPLMMPSLGHPKTQKLSPRKTLKLCIWTPPILKKNTKKNFQFFSFSIPPIY